MKSKRASLALLLLASLGCGGGESPSDPSDAASRTLEFPVVSGAGSTCSSFSIVSIAAPCLGPKACDSLTGCREP